MSCWHSVDFANFPSDKRIQRVGTNDAELIAILSSRTKDYLQRISDCYCERYGCTLVGQIKDECSFNYATFLCSMVRDKSKVDALNLRKALKGWVCLLACLFGCVPPAVSNDRVRREPTTMCWLS